MWYRYSYDSKTNYFWYSPENDEFIDLNRDKKSHSDRVVEEIAKRNGLTPKDLSNMTKRELLKQGLSQEDIKALSFQTVRHAVTNWGWIYFSENYIIVNEISHKNLRKLSELIEKYVQSYSEKVYAIHEEKTNQTYFNIPFEEILSEDITKIKNRALM